MGAARRRSSTKFKRPVLTLNHLIGGWGPYQWNIFMFDITVQLITMANVLTIAFMAPKVDFICNDHSAGQSVAGFNDSTTAVPDPLVSPLQYHNAHGYMKCYYQPPQSNDSLPCSSFTFDTTAFGQTLTSEFQLICDNSYLSSISQSLYVLGYFVASIVAGYCSDRYGRKPVLWVGVTGELVFGLACAFTPSMWFFMIGRFLLGAAIYSLFMTAYTMVMEVAGTDERTVYGPLTRVGRSIGVIVITIVSYYIRDFRYIQLAVTVPTFLWLYWLRSIPESPRWLLIKGKIDECVAVVEKAVTLNGIDLKEAGVTDIRDEIERMYVSIQSSRDHADGEKKNMTVVDLFGTPVMRRNSIIMCFNWFITVFIYYALSLNVQDLGGNLFVNFCISGVVEIPSIILCIYALKTSGRRIILSSSMIGLFFASAASVPFFFLNFEYAVATRVSLAMMGKFAATIAFTLNYLYSTEIYPTEIRQVGLGINSAASRLGSMLSPFIRELNEFTHVSVSMGVFALTSLLNAALVMMLPETKDCNIPDTIEQVEAQGRALQRVAERRASLKETSEAKMKMQAANAVSFMGDKGVATVQIQMIGGSDKNTGFTNHTNNH